MQAVYDHNHNVSQAFTSIQTISGASEEFVYALFNGHDLPPINFVSAEKRKRVDDLVSKGYEEKYALELATGRMQALNLFLLYKNDPAQFFRLLY